MNKSRSVLAPRRGAKTAFLLPQGEESTVSKRDEVGLVGQLVSYLTLSCLRPSPAGCNQERWVGEILQELRNLLRTNSEEWQFGIFIITDYQIVPNRTTIYLFYPDSAAAGSKNKFVLDRAGTAAMIAKQNGRLSRLKLARIPTGELHAIAQKLCVSV
jgi:hypothetical protein